MGWHDYSYFSTLWVGKLRLAEGQDSSRLTFSVAVQLEFQGLIVLLRQSSQCRFTLITLSLHLGLQWCRFCTRSLLGVPAVLRARPGVSDHEHMGRWEGWVPAPDRGGERGPSLAKTLQHLPHHNPGS